MNPRITRKEMEPSRPYFAYGYPKFDNERNFANDREETKSPCEEKSVQHRVKIASFPLRSPQVVRYVPIHRLISSKKVQAAQIPADPSLTSTSEEERSGEIFRKQHPIDNANRSTRTICIKINRDIYDASNASRIAQICKNHLVDFDALNISTALHQLTKYNPDSSYRELIKSLVDKIPSDIKSFNHQALCNTLSALSKLNFYDETCLTILKSEVTLKLKEFKPRSLSNTLWALANLKSQIIYQSGEFNPRNLSNTLSPLATSWIFEAKWLKTIVDQVTSMIEKLNPQDLSNTLWALATLKFHHKKFLRTCITQITSKIEQFNDQSLCNTLWAFANFQIYDEDCLRTIARQVTCKIEQFNHQSLSNTLWAFSTLGFRDDICLRAIAHQATCTINEFNPQSLSNTLLALATLTFRDETCLKAIARQVNSNIERFNTQDLCNTLWALAVLDSLDTICLSSFRAKFREFSPSSFKQVELFQLKQVDFIIKKQGLPSLLPEDSPLTSLKIPSQTPSVLQKTVGFYLNQIAKSRNETLESEKLIEDIGHYADFVLNDTMVIEIDGPSHYLRSFDAINGNTYLRNQLISLCGLSLVSIAHRDWESLANETEKVEFLLKKIIQASPVQISPATETNREEGEIVG